MRVASTKMATCKIVKTKMKNIDKIFNESLQNYERQPRTEAWEKLQAKLEKKDSKIVPLWWKYASAASVALFLGLGGYWFTSQKEVQTEVVAVSEIPVLKKEVKKEIELQKNELVKITNDNKIKNRIGCNLQTQIVIDKPKEIVIEPIEYPKDDIKIISQTTKIENKPIVEENTIVLVLENTKPKKEEETIVLNFVDTKMETVAQNIEPEKKQSRVGKIWEQLKRAKNGENVNWSEVGVKPQKVLARADAKIENVLTRGEGNDK